MQFSLKTLTVVGILFSSMSTSAGVDTETDQNDVILAGHDAVAYFTENKPVLGSAEFTAQHQSAVYRFSSTANRDLFRANPNKYGPAYGGYCALGASFGKKFEIDGQVFEVVEGRLYVNKNLDIYKTWKKAIPSNIVKAEGKWPQIKDTAAEDL